ncbi:MAG: V-type ATP synthase subunit D [Clostridiales bacterium]|nr:V-type ATP synthase subunit D [Clostridiales bacterium]
MAGPMAPPTRMQLGRIKRQLATARRGHKLLKDKRDELMRRFLALVSKARRQRETVQKALSAYYQAMAAARAEMGQAAYFAALCWPGPPLTVETGTQKAMGAVLCTLRGQAPPQPALCLETAGLKEGMAQLCALWPELLALAEMEENIRRLGREIERTRRRVGALEHVLIPDLEQAQRRIRMQLEENDRANNTRLLKVKDLVLQNAHKR